MTSDIRTIADHLLRSGRTSDAITLVAQAAESGHPEALFLQGMWQLIGVPLPRDVKAARATIHRAADIGHREASMVAIALMANGSGGEADWRGAMSLLATAIAAGDGYAQHLDRLLAKMALTADGRPTHLPAADALVGDGSIRRVRALMTAAECAHLANSATDLLAPASVADPKTGRLVPHPVRTSDAAVLSPLREDLVIRALNMRIAAISRTDVAQGEALTVLRYAPGQQFRLHSDVLPAVRNQRVMTVLIYLNEGFSGGETVFPDHQLSIVPATGDAIIFDNVDARGAPLATARHAGEPVTAGVKWLATRWIRARAFDPWQGPEAAA